MKGVSSASHTAAATAFDKIAGSYDELFTYSLIGRVQRVQVWSKLLAAFPFGSRLLELNCGTGEDARFLAERGRSIVACDASPAMIEIARQRTKEESRGATVEYLQLANEELEFFPRPASFDGAFSNFSGLNCLDDMAPVARNLSELVRPEGRVLICLWSRLCFAEVAWFLLRGEPRKSIRRVWGKARARIGGVTISVSYPTVHSIRKAFSPWFRLQSHSAVGLFVPPSYVEEWIGRHKRFLARLESLDQIFAGWPVLRNLGDHVLLEFTRCQR